MRVVESYSTTSDIVSLDILTFACSDLASCQCSPQSLLQCDSSRAPQIVQLSAESADCALCSTDSGSAGRISCRIFSSSAASDGLPLPSPDDRPLGPEPGVRPFRFQDTGRPDTRSGPTLGPARHGPARVTSCDIPGHGIMVAKPGGHDSVTKLRSSSCASVPACLPTQTCPLSGVCRCARAPREGGGGSGPTGPDPTGAVK